MLISKEINIYFIFTSLKQDCHKVHTGHIGVPIVPPKFDPCFFTGTNIGADGYKWEKGTHVLFRCDFFP